MLIFTFLVQLTVQEFILTVFYLKQIQTLPFALCSIYKQVILPQLLHMATSYGHMDPVV